MRPRPTWKLRSFWRVASCCWAAGEG